MRPFSMLMFMTICLLLIMGQPAISEGLPQPTLSVITNDPDDVIMEGDTISFFCETTYGNAKRFFLTSLGTNETKEQSGSQFTISQITSYYSGAHTCKYCDQSSCSEPSDPEHIYVRDTFPEPIISVQPRKIVHSGERMTITCSAHFDNIIFFIYKDNELVMEAAASRNTTSYEIQSMAKQNAGQYMCWYKKTTNNRLIQSHPSDPLMIRIKDLPKPTVDVEIPKAEVTSVRINCTVLGTNRKLWFQLLREDKTVEQEVEDTEQTKVTFTIMDRNEKYYCIYRIRIGTDFADSELSDMIFLGKGLADYTMGNCFHVVLSAILLIATGLILFNHIRQKQNRREPVPDLPAARLLIVKESEELEMEIQREPAKENEYKD
ncbi:Ig-like receptor 2 L homeolog isoform X1 [Xenopus laevis]|uniref:Ig-like receptor 2 L homeolog isoform X1 n=2 Tax=Xenopus laevis TaxID=8355 RepID=B1NA53_XENLA|nr:Ig-like receptor 2 L homeolog precursor [Xenopus laevis]XP_041424253.1 Ig-like receptor 2 L homeolog isoform X1 [Xenopus laevis]ABR19640.1 Ig-like receptor 2.1 [Xenopus laevis]OCT73103.1 hypothetical protein XELAEV_18036082mg [Xenopus laevis]